MVSNDDFDGKATHLHCFYLHINFEQKYPKPAIVYCWTSLAGCGWHQQRTLHILRYPIFIMTDSRNFPENTVNFECAFIKKILYCFVVARCGTMKRKLKYLVKILCNITIWQPSFCQDNGAMVLLPPFFCVWQGPSLYPYNHQPFTHTN